MDNVNQILDQMKSDAIDECIGHLSIAAHAIKDFEEFRALHHDIEVLLKHGKRLQQEVKNHE